MQTNVQNVQRKLLNIKRCNLIINIFNTNIWLFLWKYIGCQTICLQSICWPLVLYCYIIEMFVISICITTSHNAYLNNKYFKYVMRQFDRFYFLSKLCTFGCMIWVPVKCETKQKRNGTKRNRSKRNETNRNETKQIETKRNKSKRNETKRNETNRNETKRVVWNAKLKYTESSLIQFESSLIQLKSALIELGSSRNIQK